MLSKNSTRSIKQIVAGAFISIASTTAFATPIPTTLALPGINELTATLYGDFYVYSADLLSQCGGGGIDPDPRCSPSSYDDSQYKLQSGPGQISGALLVYQGGASGDNYDSASGPLAQFVAPGGAGTVGDNPFVPPSGTTSTYQFNATDEPAPAQDLGGTNNDLAAFTGDQDGTWEVQLGALATLLGFGTANQSNLVFLFDNNQTGTDAGQWLYLWASAAVLDQNGNVVSGQCYQVFTNGGATDCHTGAGLEAPNFVLDAQDKPTGELTNAGTQDYVPVVGDFCIDKVTGISYNIGTASSCPIVAVDHPEGGYLITNNLGQSLGEFAAYNAALEDFIRANYLLHPDWVLSINARFANMNDGNEQLWIGGTTLALVPEPGSLALLGLGFVAMSLSIRRSKKLIRR